MQYTVGQQAAMTAVWGLVGDPKEQWLIVSGPAGTGKSEIIKKIVSDYPVRSKAITTLTGTPVPSRVIVTATSNKAVDALAEKGIDAVTIHSLLSLKPMNGTLVKTKSGLIEDALIIIDECSFIDNILADYIVDGCGKNTKVWFLGDPYQLPPVHYENAPIFEEGIKTIELTEICRQADGNPIRELSLALRNYVMTGEPTGFTPDDKHIFHIQDEDEFVDLWLDSISSGKVTKLVAHSNPVVHNANAIAKSELEGTYSIKVGDILVCNSYVKHAVGAIKTDSQVIVTSVKPATSLGYAGLNVGLTNKAMVFVPDDPTLFKTLAGTTFKEYHQKQTFERVWADLRPGYACTIHKSQGSTYQNVFINLAELGKLNDNNLARLLYVAVSRASEKVYFTGEL